MKFCAKTIFIFRDLLRVVSSSIVIICFILSLLKALLDSHQILRLDWPRFNNKVILVFVSFYYRLNAHLFLFYIFFCSSISTSSDLLLEQLNKRRISVNYSLSEHFMWNCDALVCFLCHIAHVWRIFMVVTYNFALSSLK